MAEYELDESKDLYPEQNASQNALDVSENILQQNQEQKILILCQHHPTECIERICGSVNCRQSPLICWQCLIDQAEHVKQHRATIERFDRYLDKLQESFLQVCETRQKEAERSNIEGLQLRRDKESNFEKINGWAKEEKRKIGDEIKSFKERICQKCDETQEYFNELLDEEVKLFKENYEKMNEIIEIRYGFNAPLTLNEINENLQKENYNGKFANEYFLKIKEKLQTPIELHKNSSYMTLQSKIKLKLEKPQKFIKTEYITKRLNESLERMEKEIFNIKALFQRQYEQNLISQNQNSVDKQLESGYPFALQSDYKKMQSGKKSYGGYGDSYYQPLNQNNNNYNEYSVKKFKKLAESSSKPTPLTRQLYNQIYQENESDLRDDASSMYSSNLLDRQYYQEPMPPANNFLLKHKFQTNHTKPLNCILFIPSHNLLATGSKDKRIKLWRWNTWEQVGELEGHEDGICALGLTQSSLNEAILVSGGGNFDSSLKFWDLNKMACLRTMQGHSSAITCILPVSNSQIVLSGSYDNNIMVWNSESEQAQFILKKHSAMISCLCEVIRENNQSVQCASASWDKSISIWVLGFNGKELVKCEYLFSVLTNCAVLAMCLLEPGVLLYGGTDTLLNVYNLKSKSEVKRFQGSQFGVNELHRYDQRTILGLSANDYSLRLWDLEGNEQAVIVDPENFVMNNFNTTPKVQVVVNNSGINCFVGNCAAGKQWVTQWQIAQNQ